MMKIKNLIPVKGGPWGWIVAAGVVALITSPSVQKTARKLMVKGTATTMKLSDEARRKSKEWTEKMKNKSNTATASKYDFDFASNEQSTFDPTTECNKTESDHQTNEVDSEQNDFGELFDKNKNDEEDPKQ